jgi:hypothetical protein
LITFTQLKKLATILLSIILAFNLGGYLLLVDYLSYKERNKVQAIIENETYASNHLVELSVPVDLPYLSDWQGWEKHEGMVVINGVPHQFVERKLEAGHMHYKCLPNNGLKQVLSARETFLKLSYDLSNAPAEKGSHHQKVNVKPPVLEIIDFFGKFTLKPLSGQPKIPYQQAVNKNFIGAIITVPTPPPDVA